MGDDQVRTSNAEMARSIAGLGISDEMITQSIDRNYVTEGLPLVIFAGLYYTVLTAVHIATGVGSSHIFLAILTGSIAVTCFTGHWLIKSRVIAHRRFHVLVMIILMGLVCETFPRYG